MLFLKNTLAFLNQTNTINLIKVNKIHLTKQLDAGKLWRQKAGLPKLQTKLSIVDLPDYSFLGE